MSETLHGLIQFQEEIYVSTDLAPYVCMTTSPQTEDEQRINVHVNNVDELIKLLLAAKASIKRPKA